MRHLFLIACLLAGFVGGAWLAPAAAPLAVGSAGDAPYNAVILQQIKSMPDQGGYSASHEATERLARSVSLAPPGLDVDAALAQPSYCSGATYLVFLKTVDALRRQGSLPLDEPGFAALLIAGQRDGEGVWGRWNANGPGTARLFYEMGIGRNFTSFDEAVPGDFMKIFWSPAVGRHEHGHSVIYKGMSTENGVETVHFWSSNIKVGYSEKSVPRAKISEAIFSRLTTPANLARPLSPRVDPYLAGLLSKDSSQAEMWRLCGIPAQHISASEGDPRRPARSSE